MDKTLAAEGVPKGFHGPRTRHIRMGQTDADAPSRLSGPIERPAMSSAESLNASPVATARVALITGGAGALGYAVAQRFAEDGLHVVVADMDLAQAKRIAAALPGSGHRGIALNVTSEASVTQAFETIETELGPIAVLATFAGVVGNAPDGRQPALIDTTLDTWNFTLAVNVTGCFLCVREFARWRVRQAVPHARVITVSSSAGQLGGYQSRSPYVTSKAAVLGLTRVVARELAAQGITVNAIAPSRKAADADTDNAAYDAMAMLPLGRVGMPHEIAAAASYLASIDAAFVTGTTMDVNGGVRMQ
jgi:3-oxoacyl-[acyl-carrier protein] reductase